MDAVAVVAHEHVRLADRPRFPVDLLAEQEYLGLRVDRLDVVLGRSQHAAGAAGRVEDVNDLAFPGDGVRVRGDQQVDHQLDDLARGEVLARGLIGGFGELVDQVLEDVAHVVVGQLVQVAYLGELADDAVEQLGFGEPRDLVVEVEPGEDAPDVRRKAVDVIAEVLGHLTRVTGYRREILPGRVVEGQFRRDLQHALFVLHVERRVAGPHRRTCRRHHRVEPAQQQKL